MYDALIDAQVRLLQAHVSVVEEMQRIANTRNRLARIFRCVLEEPLEVSGYPSVCAGTCAISKDAVAMLGGERSPHRREYVAAGLRYEHPVPLTSVLYPMLRPVLSNPDRARQMIIEYLRPAWITLEEDQRLALNGLARRMPNGWQEGSGVFARYEAVQIEFL
jgi:hypothetical protein